MSAPPSLQSILDPSNPLAYLAYLPPSLAYQLTIMVYVLVAATVVQIWDISNNLNEDYKLIIKRPISFPGVVYCISRISTLTYLLYALIYETAPMGHCETLSKVGPWVSCVSFPSTALLFYFRVRAIYNNGKYVSGFFFLMWLGVLGGSLTSVTGVAAYNIGPTKHCLNGTLKSIVSMGAIFPLVYDSLIFVAISLRLMQIGMSERADIKDVFKAVIFAKDMPTFTRALLRDGQVYYLSATTLSLIFLIIFYIDSIPLIYRTVLGIPNSALINIMACRVYRRTKSGKYRENTTMDSLTLPLSFARGSQAGNNNVSGLVESQIFDIRGSAAFAVSKPSIGGSNELSTDPNVFAEKGTSESK